jgi:AraC-like DNA-binding protein
MTPEIRLPIMLAMLAISAGAMFAMSIGMLRARKSMARWTGVIFEVSAAAYAIKLWNDETGIIPGAAMLPIFILSVGCVGWFWLFVLVLFEDRQSVRPVYYLPILAPVLLSLSALAFSPSPLAFWCAILGALMRIGLALHILAIVMRSWENDLVEVRRRLRGPFVIVVTIYILAICFFDLWEAFLGPVPMYPLINSFVLAIVAISGAFVFIEARDELFSDESAAALRPPPRAETARANGGAHLIGVPVSGVPANGLDRAVLDRTAKADLERLQALMTTQQVWREEGLTIASLALKAGMPEAQLRRLINDCLGYRNFPSYVNAHRISAAKSRLSDPNEARVTVSTIAYDIGFASLGPFNRAFREETGVSPSEWRRNSLNEPSPISEDA